MSVTPFPLLDQLVDAYNAGDADSFADLLSADVVVVSHPERLLQSGNAEVRSHYRQVFSANPGNRTEVLHRIVLGDRVVDHERVSRSDNADPFDVVTIYTIAGARISRIDFVSQAKAGE